MTIFKLWLSKRASLQTYAWHISYAHAHFDDLDLDARSQWLGRGNIPALNYLDTKASNKHAQLKSVSHDLDFENIFLRLEHLVVFNLVLALVFSLRLFLDLHDAS